jgi:(S)-sulfolactate dehydrogenase
MADIVITEFLDEAALAAVPPSLKVLYDPKLVDKPAELLAAVTSARALVVRNRTQVRGDLLAAGKVLKCVGRLGVGLDNIDVEACKARGIAVFPASGANDISVAEWVLASAMVLLRGAYGATDQVIAGKWPRNDLIGREIFGKTLGLVGYGAIARHTADRARALGMTILGYDPYLPASDPVWLQAKHATLDELLAHSDVVSLHVPLTPETRGLINPRSLKTMKPGAILINASRGGVVDEAAAADALRSGYLGGLALDVFDREPLPAELGSVFAGTRNLILTPHIAGVTQESNVRVSKVTIDTVLRHLGVH